MTEQCVTVHIAGEMICGLQVCTRCGETLTDYRGCMVASEGPEPPVLNGWTQGSFVGHSGWCWFLMSHDAEQLDETRCGSLTQ